MQNHGLRMAVLMLAMAVVGSPLALGEGLPDCTEDASATDLAGTATVTLYEQDCAWSYDYGVYSGGGSVARREVWLRSEALDTDATVGVADYSSYYQYSDGSYAYGGDHLAKYAYLRAESGPVALQQYVEWNNNEYFYGDPAAPQFYCSGSVLVQTMAYPLAGVEQEQNLPCLFPTSVRALLPPL